jgi:hypothetical protein
MNVERGWKKRRDTALRRTQTEAQRHDIRRQRGLLNGTVVEPEAAVEAPAPEVPVETPVEPKPARKPK